MLIIAAAAATAVVPLTASPTAAASHDGGLIAVTEQGVVHGIKVGNIRQFLGLPYAAAPVGDLRWRPPQPAARWHGVRDATTFGAHCPQSGGAFGRASTSEDCLFLSVYQPPLALPELPFAPVMVWIHGGALVSGESDDYDPAPLVQRGVIVVTINYRLGALGFLAHPALAAESPQGAAGNYGLLDQQAALRWVQRNIRHFGGDADNVTVFGESAGGLSVHSQLASPLAKGLFQRAIVESGSYQLTQPSLTAAEATGSAFATRAGCADQSAACLRSLPVATILAKQNPTGASPTVDGFVLTTSVGEAFKTGNFNKVPVMEGTNHDEWRLFVAITELQTHAPLSAAGYIPAISATLQVPASTAAALATRYPLANYPSPSLALGALGTDAIFACNARTATRSMSAQVKVYQYEFNDPNAPARSLPPVSFPTGAQHAAEIQYLFNLNTPIPGPGFTPDQQKLSQTMVRYWTQFAWAGNPNSFGTPFWPAFDDQLRNQELVPGTSITVTNFATDHRCALFGG